MRSIAEKGVSSVDARDLMTSSLLDDMDDDITDSDVDTDIDTDEDEDGDGDGEETSIPFAVVEEPESDEDDVMSPGVDSSPRDDTEEVNITFSNYRMI